MYRKAITKKKSFGKSSITLKTIKKKKRSENEWKKHLLWFGFFFNFTETYM